MIKVIYTLSYILYFYLFKENDFDASKINRVDRLTQNLFTQREENYKIRYSSIMLLGSIFCRFEKCKSKRYLYKDHQYESCLKEVNEFTNLNYIVRKIKELDYVKAVVFNREQSLSFDFFHKPLIAEKNKKVNKIINQIHNDQFNMPSHVKLDLIKEYYKNVSPDFIENHDIKILELIDMEFV